MVAIKRDWNALKDDLEVLGPTLTAGKHGYSNPESMLASIRNHDRTNGMVEKREQRKVAIAVNQEEAVSLVGQIPDEIERQLLSTETIPVSQLIVDHRYQRYVIESSVRKMAQEWNWLGAGLLTVSLRPSADGNEYAVIDGQQRLAAIKLLGYTEAPCRIYVDLTPTQEAELFEILNQNKKVNFNSTFKSRLSRGEEKARMINMAVEQVNYHLDPDRTHGGVKAKNTHYYIQSMPELERIYDTGGVNLIMNSLKFINTTWAPEYLGNQQQVLAGVATFLQNYPKTNLKDLTDRLKKQGMSRTLQNATQWTAVHGQGGGGTNKRGRAFSEAMLACYNQNRQEANRIRSKVI